MDQFVGKMTMIFAQQIQEGKLSKAKNPEALAQFMFSTMSSIKLISRKTQDQQMLQNIADTAIWAIIL